MRLYRLGIEEILGANFGYFMQILSGTSRRVGRSCPNPLCPAGRPERRRIRPATVDFVGGPAGDFMTGIGILLARREVAEELAGRFTEIRPCPIVVSKPRRGHSLRYSGPEMLELHFPFVVPFNPNISTLKLKSCCQACGRVYYDIEGIELRPREVKINERWVMVDREPRKPGQGVIVFEEDLGGRDFFVFGDWLPICTEKAKDYIEERGWTNVSFIEYGEVVDESWAAPESQ